jgi:rRNA processing protein Krr1/Pno1
MLVLLLKHHITTIIPMVVGKQTKTATIIKTATKIAVVVANSLVAVVRLVVDAAATIGVVQSAALVD